MDLLAGIFFQNIKVPYHNDCLLGGQVVPLRGERAKHAISWTLRGNLLMLFPGNSSGWELYPKLCFSQVFKSSFPLFLWWSLLFILVHNIPPLVLYTSCSLSLSVPLNELFYLLLPCTGELLILQDSLMNPYRIHFPLPGRVKHPPPLSSHSILYQPSDSSCMLFRRIFCPFHLC